MKEVNFLKLMDKKKWKKIEPIVDSVLSMESTRKKREFIKQTCNSYELYQEVAELIMWIEKAEEEEFLE